MAKKPRPLPRRTVKARVSRRQREIDEAARKAVDKPEDAA